MNAAEGAPSSRMLSSIPANPGLISGVLRLLELIDDLPRGATGALHFGDEGMILVESKKICWAVSRGMRLRLTEILRRQTTPPLTREAVEELYRACKQTGTPIGEALVANGVVSEAGLRAALFKHNGEAIVSLAQNGASVERFVSHSKTGYDPKYAFSSCEVLAMLGARDDPARAAAAQSELDGTLVQDSVGAAFVRSSRSSGPLVIAVDSACGLAVTDLLQACAWVSGLFDMARTFDPDVFAARAALGARATLVTWRSNEVEYVGLCASRPAAARLMSRMAQRAPRTSGVMALGVRQETSST
ncbi:MAG: hypothetical protein ABUL60_18860 [Myxococcales bacterium]